MATILRKDLEAAWQALTPEQQERARDRARSVLGNLIHYTPGRRYLADDVELLAAELAGWAKEQR